LQFKLFHSAAIAGYSRAGHRGSIERRPIGRKDSSGRSALATLADTGLSHRTVARLGSVHSAN